MDVSYNKFFKILIDRKMKKKRHLRAGRDWNKYYGKNGKG